MNTKQWIDFAISETETALALLYTYMQFHKLLEKPQVVKLINRNPEFWRLHNGAVQQTLFLYLGRIADDTKGAKSFSGFQSHCITNLSSFSREEFLKRRPDILRLNPTFLDGKTQPSKKDLSSLFKLSSTHSKFLRGECKTIRSQVFAHAILTEETQYNELFSQVSLKNIESSLLTYWSISKHIWECYHNARNISVEILEYPDKETIFANTTKAIYGPFNDSAHHAHSELLS